MISIRKLTIEDVITTFAYSSNHENTYYMLNSPFLTIDETKEFVSKCIAEYESKNPRFLSFAVVYNDVHVGEVFASISKKEADIGWIIDKRYWGKGIATCGAKLFIEYLKNEHGIEHLISCCDARNMPSRRIMEKLGMKFVGENGIRYYDKEVSPNEELKFEMHL